MKRKLFPARSARIPWWRSAARLLEGACCALVGWCVVSALLLSVGALSTGTLPAGPA